jgi:hypothetical protein
MPRRDADAALAVDGSGAVKLPRYGQAYLWDRSEVNLPITKRAASSENHDERAVLMALGAFLVFIEWCRASRYALPMLRSGCAELPRPCPVSQCRYHTNEGDPLGCSLDYADLGEMTEDDIASVFGVSRQGISLTYLNALASTKRVGGSKLRTIATEMMSQQETSDRNDCAEAAE